MSLIPGSGRSPGEGHDNPLQYSCLGNPLDRGAWGTTVHGVTKESGMTERLNNNRQGTALGGAHALDHIVGASGGLLACGSNSQLCPEGHPALTPLAVTCAIIRSNFSSRKYCSPVLPFFFFPCPCGDLFSFVPCSFCSRHTGWGSKLGRPRISGLWVGCYLWCTSLSAGPAPPSQLAAAVGRCLQSGICSGPAERAGSLPLQMVRMTPWLCQASPMSPPHMWGPEDHFFSPSEASFCCFLVENERLGDCTLLSCDSHLQPQALRQGSGMNPKGGVPGED